MIKFNFDVKNHKLNNGLEVITIKKDTQLASVNIGVKVGALYEDLSQKGISHFIEHMIFKGTKTKDYKEVNDSLELLGGEYNAYTDFLYTVYTISCLEEEIFNGVELLGDMLINSSFSKEEIEKERGVILAEIRTSKDDVEDYSFKRANEIAFNNSSLKYDVAGLESNVKKFKRKDLLEFYNKYYRPNNTVLTLVSSYEHEEAIKKIESLFGHWEASTEEIKISLDDEKNIEKKVITYKDNIEQATIVYLYTFYDLERDYELPLRILNHRLGESSNSLLFREVRENKGLSYDIYTNLDMSKHVKTLYIYTAVAEEDIDKAIKAIDETINKIKKKKIDIGEKDFEVMKKVHKTGVVAILEDSSELCNYILHQALDGEDVYEFIEDMKRLNYVKKDKIYEVANKVLKKPTIHILKSN